LKLENLDQSMFALRGTGFLSTNIERVLSPREERERDEAKTGRPRCIGCGKFLKVDADWNQCADCDTRSYDY